MEEIYFKDEVKEKLFNGIEKLYKAVSSTMGPHGKTVTIVDAYNKPIVTKDGVSVAKAINFRDPVENVGAQLVKQAAEKTVSDAGDGTTTSTVLAYSLVKNLKDFNYNDVSKALEEIIPKVIAELKKNSKVLKQEDIKYVASVSANNDTKIGELIQKAFDFSKTIKVEESNNNEDVLETINGMQLDVSYFSKHFITDEKKGECNLISPSVIVIDGKLNNLDNLSIYIQELHKQNKSLLIITEEVNESVLKILESVKINNDMQICVIKSPGFGPFRKDLLNDICSFIDSKLYNPSKPLQNNNIGKLDSCKISKTKSILIKDPSIDISNKIQDLSEYTKTLEGYDKELVEKRIEYLTAQVSIIKVGGRTELEMKERKDRIDDAVLAVSSALEEGIVEGGGHALVYTIPTDKAEYTDIEMAIYKSLNSPFYTIWQNGGIKDFNRNMFDLNIVDPLKVTRCALENAVSVAKTILSTDTVVLNEYLWKV